MKATAAVNYHFYTARHKADRFPGCTRKRFSWNKVLDILLAAAITVAAVVILLFFLTIT